MDEAINGTTTITLRRGGTIDISGGLDFKLLHNASRQPPVHLSGQS